MFCYSNYNHTFIRLSLFSVGGGNAEFVASREELLMPVPDNMEFNRAAAIPEVWLTAFQLLFLVG